MQAVLHWLGILLSHMHNTCHNNSAEKSSSFDRPCDNVSSVAELDLDLQEAKSCTQVCPVQLYYKLLTKSKETFFNPVYLLLFNTLFVYGIYHCKAELFLFKMIPQLQ